MRENSCYCLIEIIPWKASMFQTIQDEESDPTDPLVANGQRLKHYITREHDFLHLTHTCLTHLHHNHTKIHLFPIICTLTFLQVLHMTITTTLSMILMLFDTKLQTYALNINQGMIRRQKEATKHTSTISWLGICTHGWSGMQTCLLLTYFSLFTFHGQAYVHIVRHGLLGSLILLSYFCLFTLRSMQVLCVGEKFPSLISLDLSAFQLGFIFFMVIIVEFVE